VWLDEVGVVPSQQRVRVIHLCPALRRHGARIAAAGRAFALHVLQRHAGQAGLVHLGHRVVAALQHAGILIASDGEPECQRLADGPRRQVHTRERLRDRTRVRKGRNRTRGKKQLLQVAGRDPRNSASWIE